MLFEIKISGTYFQKFLIQSVQDWASGSALPLSVPGDFDICVFG